MQPLVSILIPAFNAERWIADTIKSALGQTWQRKEIIIVDDGSADRTLSIARQFASKEVSVITQPNQGATSARNKALSLSQGGFIQWLDADDLLASDKIGKQMEAVTRYPSKRTLLSSAWGSFFYRFDRAKFSVTPLWNDLSPLEWLLRKLDQNLSMQTGVWLVSRELTTAAGPWDSRLSYDDDGEYFVRVVLASDGIRFLPEAKVFYRRGLDSLSYIGRSSRKLESLLLSTQLQVGYLRSLEDGENVRSACLKYLQTTLPYFYPERPDLVKRLEQIAASVGGHLETPRMSWKYAWIQKLFGWTPAKLTQLYYNQCKLSVMRSWDKTMFQFETSKFPNI